MQPEGYGGPCAMGEQGSAPSGVYDYGTLEEDGPDTWETLIAPCGTRARVGRRQGTTGAEADGDEGVGGLHTSDDAGERVPTWTRPSKGGPCWCDRSEGPMTGASTSANHVTATSNGSGPRATSHISGRAGWWKSPSPDLVRASGE